MARPDAELGAADPKTAAELSADGPGRDETYAQLFNIPVSYAQESLQAARFPLEGYDDLTVEDVHARISSLTL